MKTISIFLLALGGAMAIGLAQSNNADVIKNGLTPPPKSSDYLITYQTNVPYARRLGDMQITYGGVLHDAKQGGARRLLEPGPATGPARPFENVSVNPRTGKAEGVILFSVKF
jgi:hypothetical protein